MHFWSRPGGIASRLGIALMLAACDAAPTTETAMASDPRTSAATPALAAASAFLGLPLPPGASAIELADTAGIDRLVLLRLDAPDAAAAAFAAALLGEAPRAGVDPGLGYLGSAHPWWATTPPPGARGGEATRPGNRSVKLIAAPIAPGVTRLWVAVFSQ